MTEFMQKKILMPLVINSECAKKVVNPASAITVLVDHDNKRVIGNMRGNITKRFIVLSQKIACRSQRIEGGVYRGVLEDAVPGLVTTALL